MNYCAEKYGIVSGHDITWALQKALASVENENGEKALIFQKGEYHLYWDKARTGKLYISNTVGDNEWEKDDVPHLCRAGIWLEKQRNLIIDGGGSVFVMHGK